MRTRVVLVAVAIIALGWWFFVRVQHPRHGGGARMEMEEAAGSYATYTGTDAALLLTFERRTDWKLQEERGTMDVYSQVRVLGPRNADDTYRCYVSVRGAPMKAFGGRHGSVEELVQSYRDHVFKNAHVEVARQRTVAGLQATDVTASFTVPPLHKPGLKAIPIPVKTRVLFFEKDPYLYELIYSADAREYDRYADVFERLITTLRFQ